MIIPKLNFQRLNSKLRVSTSAWKRLQTDTALKMGKMKDSSLLKWTQNNKNNKLTGSAEKKEKKNGKTKEEKKKNWLHTPENLTSGHIAYLVKVIWFGHSPGLFIFPFSSWDPRRLISQRGLKL